LQLQMHVSAHRVRYPAGLSEFQVQFFTQYWWVQPREGVDNSTYTCALILNHTSISRILLGQTPRWSSQVLCSARSWEAASSPLSKLEGIAAVNAGMHVLKGIQGPVSLYSCTYTHTYTAGARCRSASVADSCSLRRLQCLAYLFRKFRLSSCCEMLASSSRAHLHMYA
jgi:hypothetical protein